MSDLPLDAQKIGKWRCPIDYVRLAIGARPRDQRACAAPAEQFCCDGRR